MGPDDVCFLRYEARQTEFFVILSHFLHFYTTNNPTKKKKKKFQKIKKKKKKKKNAWRDHHFKQVYQES